MEIGDDVWVKAKITGVSESGNLIVSFASGGKYLVKKRDVKLVKKRDNSEHKKSDEDWSGAQGNDFTRTSAEHERGNWGIYG